VATTRAGGWFDVILTANAAVGLQPLIGLAACPGSWFAGRRLDGRRAVGGHDDRSGLVRPLRGVSRRVGIAHADQLGELEVEANVRSPAWRAATLKGQPRIIDIR
jgi:hypothetical protein